MMSRKPPHHCPGRKANSQHYIPTKRKPLHLQNPNTNRPTNRHTMPTTQNKTPGQR
ncbi:hypothetical protein MA16_Dca028965 [Dendrobium catenatum]|uniref:Uncharacterized protein n=1 Tax=Dendrobium catenatum TaxID=906689 RepID=A0A2I0VB46_9ASPA|nr:hypothetical protein MA16_Dca028965 [Dendrobium catenatum]